MREHRGWYSGDWEKILIKTKSRSHSLSQLARGKVCTLGWSTCSFLPEMILSHLWTCGSLWMQYMCLRKVVVGGLGFWYRWWDVGAVWFFFSFIAAHFTVSFLFTVQQTLHITHMLTISFGSKHMQLSACWMSLFKCVWELGRLKLTYLCGAIWQQMFRPVDCRKSHCANIFTLKAY